MFLLYIDPGTGSLLFSVFIGLIAASYFFFRTLLIKLKSLFFIKNKITNKKHTFTIYNEALHYWPIFQPVLQEFENRKIDLQYLTSSETDPVFKQNYTYIHPEFIGTGNKAFAVLNIIETDVCLMTTPGLDVYQLKRSKLCKHYSHILHDTGDATCYRLFGIDWFDSILLSGEYQKADIEKLEDIRSIPKKELYVVGSTYLDYYNSKIPELEINTHNIFTVLISPSWGQSALLSALGEKLLDCFVNSGWNIIIRPHPQSKKSEAQLLKNLEEKYVDFTWDYNTENLESLSKADIMISDFSGIIFDYVFLFNKPVLYHSASFNKEMYDAGDLEHDPWKFKASRRFGVELNEVDLPNIKQIIQNMITNCALTDERIIAKNIAWQNQGKSANYVTDTLLEIRNRL